RRKEAVSRLAIASEVVHVGKEHRQLHEIGGRASARPERDRKVAEHLFGLRGKIILDDYGAITADGGLAGDEEDTAGGKFDDLRVAGRLPELRRIETVDRCVGCHVVLSPSTVAVGWAKRLVRRSSKSEGGSVPTFKSAAVKVGTAQARLCPPYGSVARR